jgi:hypothetical protein
MEISVPSKVHVPWFNVRRYSPPIEITIPEAALPAAKHTPADVFGPDPISKWGNPRYPSHTVLIASNEGRA